MSNTEHPDFVTTYKSIGGWKAVLMTWTQEKNYGFYEPWNTGVGSYKAEKAAIVEAKMWAESEEIEYKPRTGEM